MFVGHRIHSLAALSGEESVRKISDALRYNSHMQAHVSIADPSTKHTDSTSRQHTTHKLLPVQTTEPWLHGSIVERERETTKYQTRTRQCNWSMFSCTTTMTTTTITMEAVCFIVLDFSLFMHVDIGSVRRYNAHPDPYKHPYIATSSV